MVASVLIDSEVRIRGAARLCELRNRDTRLRLYFSLPNRSRQMLMLKTKGHGMQTAVNSFNQVRRRAGALALLAGGIIVAATQAWGQAVPTGRYACMFSGKLAYDFT